MRPHGHAHTRVRDRVRDIRSVGAVVLFCVLAGKCEAVSEIIHFPLVLQTSTKRKRAARHLEVPRLGLQRIHPRHMFERCVQRGPLLPTADAT